MEHNPWKRPRIEKSPRILTVTRRPGDTAARIDLYFFRDRIVRFLRLSSHRLRTMLGMARTTELSPITRPANVEQVIMDTRKELHQITRTTRVTPIAAHPRFREQATQANHEAATPQRDRAPVTVSGTLVTHGSTERKLRGKAFDQYYVDLAVEELGGQTQRFWGADLERCITQCGAQQGDRVRLQQHGAVPVTVRGGNGESGGRSAYKNAFHMERLERAEGADLGRPAADHQSTEQRTDVERH